VPSRAPGLLLRNADESAGIQLEAAQNAAPHRTKGFVFITLEDEDGLMNVFVRPDVYERYYRTLRNSLRLLVEGTTQKQQRIPRVLAEGAVELE
jgi:DNA polymerase III alpha subunit